jgi:3-deoxy-D-manno-octulosonate 8-phosphate phosphatase (KDO 8-P phosphatase)
MTLPEQLKKITTFVLDVDGVLTDGTVLAFENGEQVRQMSVKDGFILQLAVKKGYRILIISGGNAAGVVTRLSKLGINNILMGVHDKRELLLQYMSENKLVKDEVLFMGDDIPDYTAMLEAGVKCAPADACPEIKKIATYIASAKGGKGCVREVMEKVLKLNGHWELDTNVPSR